uniref:Pecanex-like protein n=1 Tax=Macrostomum lignano TaxID=282301 RepID=A0A1I8H5S8_9PLAT
IFQIPGNHSTSVGFEKFSTKSSAKDWLGCHLGAGSSTLNSLDSGSAHCGETNACGNVSTTGWQLERLACRQHHRLRVNPQLLPVPRRLGRRLPGWHADRQAADLLPDPRAAHRP